MLDPVPFGSPGWVNKYAQQIAEMCSLQSLPLHAHEVIVSFAFYQLVQSYISPRLSKSLFPSIYPKLNRRTKLNWDVHVVSLVQSTLICSLALWVMAIDKERKSLDRVGRVFGYTGAGGLVQGFAAGYFLWDLVISVRYVKIFGWGLLAHAVAAFAVFSFGFRPFLNFYGPTFVLYELSSPFLNFHWFFDKLNMTGSKPQWYNGMILLSVFFCCRLCWGTYQSILVYMDVWAVLRTQGTSLLEWSRAHNATLSVLTDMSFGDKFVAAKSEVIQFADDNFVPVWLAIIYMGSNLTLNALNYFWFSKMIETIRKRFRDPQPTKKEKRHSQVIPDMPPELVDGSTSPSEGEELLKHGTSSSDDVAVPTYQKTSTQTRRRRA